MPTTCSPGSPEREGREGPSHRGAVARVRRGHAHRRAFRDRPAWSLRRVARYGAGDHQGRCRGQRREHRGPHGMARASSGRGAGQGVPAGRTSIRPFRDSRRTRASDAVSSRMTVERHGEPARDRAADRTATAPRGLVGGRPFRRARSEAARRQRPRRADLRTARRPDGEARRGGVERPCEQRRGNRRSVGGRVRRQNRVSALSRPVEGAWHDPGGAACRWCARRPTADGPG